MYVYIHLTPSHENIFKDNITKCNQGTLAILVCNFVRACNTVLSFSFPLSIEDRSIFQES